MALKTVLLDFDNVIHRNSRILKHQKQACGKLLGDNVMLNNPQLKNAKLCKKYGHTNKILKSYGVNMSYKDFNNLLDTYYLNHNFISSCITSDDVFLAKEWEHIIERLTDELDFHVVIFTNGGFNWCRFVLEQLHIQPKPTIISADMIESVKPDEESYNTIEEILSPQYLLADDSTKNVEALEGHSNWNTCLYLDDMTPYDVFDVVIEKNNVIYN